MAFQKAGDGIVKILGNVLESLILNVKEEEILGHYQEYIREGVNNMNINLRMGFENYLLASKNNKLNLVAKEMKKEDLYRFALSGKAQN